jgi:methionine synthase II (cobalamin-independent)
MAPRTAPPFRADLATAYPVEITVAVINQALAGRPAGLTVTVHMCRGNY